MILQSLPILQSSPLESLLTSPGPTSAIPDEKVHLGGKSHLRVLRQTTLCEANSVVQINEIQSFNPFYYIDLKYCIYEFIMGLDLMRMNSFTVSSKFVWDLFSFFFSFFSSYPTILIFLSLYFWWMQIVYFSLHPKIDWEWSASSGD